MDHPPELAEALRHERALRRLAWLLHLGAADADDAVQHTLTQVALGKRPLAMPLATFLRTTLRHHAANLRKLAGRRRAREAAAANDTDVAMPVDAMVAREQLRQRVAAAVLALDEPYRTTVWLRWFEGLAADEVAQRMHTPLNTVRTRLQRAHAQLRARLDHDYGDRRWGALAAPLGAVAGATGTPLAVHVTIAATLTLLGAVLFAAMTGGGDTPPPVVADRDAQTARVDAGHAPVASAATPLAREPVVPRAAVPVPPAPVAPAARPAPTDALLVRTAAGEPAVERAVWWWSEDERPTWTERARRRAGWPNGTDDVFEHPEPPATSLRTDGRGAIVVPSPRPVAVTVELAPRLWFSAEVPRAGPLVLPATGEVAVRVAGAPRDDTWALRVLFALPGDNATAEVRLDVDTGSGPGVVRYHAAALRGPAHETLRATVPVGGKWLWQADATGHGFLIADAPPPRAAPCTIVLRVLRRVPRVIVTVREAGGATTGRGGMVRLRHEGGGFSLRPLEAGRAVFDVQETYGLRPEVRVRMHDGEEAGAVAELAAHGWERRCELRLSGRNEAQRVHVDDLRCEDLHLVLVETDTGWRRVPDLAQPGHDATLEYGCDGGSVWIAGLPIVAGRQVALVTDTGATALGTFSWLGLARAEWCQPRPVEDIDVGALYAESGDRPVLRAELALGLRRASGAVDWMLLWSHLRMPDGDGQTRPPRWRGLTLPVNLPARVRVLDGPGSDSAVLLER